MQQMNARREQSQTRRDPAPSKWHYRYERWMLTPFYRRLIKVGIPTAIVAMIGTGYFINEDRRQQVADLYAETVNTVRQRPEFMVNVMAVDGGDTQLADEIRTVLPVDFPVSSFDLDLEQMRETVEAVNGVARATLRIKPGGTLEVAVVPRVPVAIWRQNDTLRMIDAEGNYVAPVGSRADRLDLPLIAGDGAKDAIIEALNLFRAAGPISENVRGLVRMGERRWDMILKNDQRILLPETNPITALERVVVMAQVQDLLERDVSIVDMRNDDRPTIRLGSVATEEMRRINAAVAGAGN